MSKQFIDMVGDEAVGLVFSELRKAEAKFPGWPLDCVHAAAIVSEESGELTQAALDYFYGREKTTDTMKTEAAQTAAMGLRFLLHLCNPSACTKTIRGYRHLRNIRGDTHENKQL